MKIEQLQLIERNETSDIVLKWLSRSKPVSNDTNLESFISFLINKGNNINAIDFFRLFKQLEEAEAGSITSYKGQHPSKFVWHYSLQDVCQQILNPNRMMNIHSINEEKEESENIVTIKRGRGRPKGSRNEKIVNDQQPAVAQSVAKPRGRPRGYRPSQNREIVFMFTTSKGTNILFNLNDAESLIKQVESIKAQIA